ncbi:MAG: 3'-5' exonuclease [Cyanobacteria bacterium P01_E01_bin.34]
MNVLIIDTETTGLDPQRDRVIELGAILYSIDHNSTLHQLSVLLPTDCNPQEKLNGISAAASQAISNPLLHQSLAIFGQMVAESDYAIAHNADFDRQWFNGQHLPQLTKDNQPLPWLCTMSDFRWPLAAKQGCSLVNLALDYGIGVNAAHRALTDCQLIAMLFDRVTNLPALVALASQPKYLYRANVSYDNRSLAKEAGFRWNSKAKIWSRKLGEQEIDALPFSVSRL